MLNFKTKWACPLPTLPTPITGHTCVQWCMAVEHGKVLSWHKFFPYCWNSFGQKIVQIANENAFKRRNLPIALLINIWALSVNVGLLGRIKSCKINAPTALIPEDTVLKWKTMNCVRKMKNIELVFVKTRGFAEHGRTTIVQSISLNVSSFQMLFITLVLKVSNIL